MPDFQWQDIFRDKNGKFVIAQKPNLPIIVWLVSFIMARIDVNQTVTELAEYISFGSLFTWAWLEIFEGVNLFRRALGLVVMVFLLYLSLQR